MNRRRLLRLVGAATVTTAGCLGGRDDTTTTEVQTRPGGTAASDAPAASTTEAPTATASDTARQTRTDSPTETATGTDNPTADSGAATDSPTEEEWRPTPTPNLCFGGGERYPAFGESVVIDSFELTAKRATLTQTYGLDHTEETYRLSDRQYVVTEFEVTNRSHGRDEWPEVRTFEYVTTPCRQFDVLGSIPRPGRNQPVYELERVGHFKQGQSHGYSLAAGESGPVWYVGLLPADRSADEIELAFYGDDGEFPLRWRLDDAP